MPTTGHIPPTLLTSVDRGAKALGVSRNRLIVRALEQAVNERSRWAPECLERLRTVDRETGAAAVIHPPEHCLPGSGWDVIESDVVPLDVGIGGEAKRFMIAKGSQRSLVYFWYHSRGHVIARSHEKILWMFLDSARRGRTDGSLVRFTIPVQRGDVAAAEAHFQDLAQSVAPLLSEYVPD